MNSVLVGWSSLGAALFAWVVPALVWSAALFTGALVLDRALARRVRASYRILLYLPLAIRLATPMRWQSPLGLVNAPLGFIHMEDAIIDGAAGHPSYTMALVGVTYAAVAALLLMAWWRAHVKLARAVAAARPARADVAALERGCAVVEHQALGPMVVGILHPRIVLPSALAGTLDPSSLRCVLAHEKAHIERGDGLLTALLALSAIAAWPVVPVWLAVARVRQLIEVACDQAALSESSAAFRRRYGETLLAVADWQPLGYRPAAHALHFGSQLAMRIGALRWRRRWPTALQVAAVALVSTLLLACAAFAKPPETAREGSAAAAGSLDKEVIRRVIRRHASEVKACYQAESASSPANFRIMTKFTIGPDGLVLDYSSTGDAPPTFDACLGKAIRSWEFPKPVGGGNVVVQYPFTLRSE